MDVLTFSRVGGLAFDLDFGHAPGALPPAPESWCLVDWLTVDVPHAQRGRCCQRRLFRAIEHTIVALVLDPSIPIAHFLLLVNTIRPGLVPPMLIPNS